MRMRVLLSAVGVILSVCLAGAGRAAEKAEQAEQAAGRVILNTDSMWRMRLLWETEEVLLKSGKVGHVVLKFKGSRATRWKTGPTTEKFEVEKVPVLREPAKTPADWMKPDFDDSQWAYGQGPLLSGGTRTQRSDAARGVGWKLLLLRGKFEVTDPARAEGLTLSAVYKGGIVVYLNGEEITRSDMPAGKVGPYTCAVPYAKAVWIRSDGHGMKGGDYRSYLRKVKSDASAPRRVRGMTGFKVPANRLKKGQNVLAISVHRPPARWELYATRIKPYPLPTETYPRLALHSVELIAPRGAAVASAAAGKDAGRLRAWNYSIARRVFTSFYKHAPVERLRPVRIVGCRNGVFSGQLVLGCANPIKGLKVQVGDLKGPGTVPAQAVNVHYGLPDGWVHQGWMMSVKGPWFDGLEERPPAVAPVYKDGAGAVQPVWFKVTVPKDAKSGDYKATVEMTADGAEPIQTQIELKVMDWALPAPKDFILDMDYFQSPDTLAMKYKVPFWSDKHWELIEKSFIEMERFSGKTVYITCIRQTQLGNQHAMVRWVRDAKGNLTPDISLAEKYLDIAAKHQAIKAVVLYVWAPPSSEGEYGAVGVTHDREIFISVLDKKTGKLTEEKGPVWGTPASWKFWAKLTLAMKAALKKRGLEDKMMYGLLGDHRATRKAMDDISAAAPKTLWALQSHTYCEQWKGKKLGMCSAFWGIRAEPRDPAVARGHGWQNPYWLTYGPRDSTRTVSQIARYRTLPELWITASATSASRWKKAVGVRGLSRLGTDFWRVLDKRRSQFGGLTIIGRYPETEWGHLSFARGTPALLRPGKNGAVPSIRSEAMRENIQEIEARVFIEKALLDKNKKAKLGEELARRCQECLDKRIRVALHLQVRHTFSFIQGWPFYVTGLENRTEMLFSLAAEVAKKLGT